MSTLNGETFWSGPSPRSNSRAVTGFAGRMAEVLATWCKPRSSAHLDQLSRHVLRDIGMSRFGIIEAPFSHRR